MKLIQDASKMYSDGGEKPRTRCWMSSMVSKIYYPLGFAAPFLLNVKRILQVLCKSNYSWDEAVSADCITD